jgi:uncharacterized membrane protein YgdD (TMEM256/DUF423 family)
MNPLTKLLAGLNGFAAVAIGAFGAHALKDTLELHDTQGAWKTASTYHLVHAVACLALIAWTEAKPANAAKLPCALRLWLLGCLLFSGSLYILALGGPRFFGPITPLGGLAFLAGWALVAWNSMAKEKPAA